MSSIEDSAIQALERAPEVKVETWQGLATGTNPSLVTKEVLDFRFSWPIPAVSLSQLRDILLPDLPWADNHFEERISGEPMNPGHAYATWPWHEGQNVEKFLNKEGKFDVSYMERIWAPKLIGIRGQPWGNLSDVLNLLALEPHTRRAYLPLFFPDDTGVGEWHRTMCSLGYHFMRRGTTCHMWYELRSCDFVRHFRNDIYLAVRMLLWVLDQLKSRTWKWELVTPGNLYFCAHSLHYHRGDEHHFRRMVSESGGKRSNLHKGS